MIGVIATVWPGISTGRIVVVIFVIRFVYNNTADNRFVSAFFVHSHK